MGHRVLIAGDDRVARPLGAALAEDVRLELFCCRRERVESEVVRHAPELILLDATTEFDATLTTCRRLKLDEEAGHVPILLVLENDGVRLIEAAFSAGVSDCIILGIDGESLRLRLRAAFALKREIDSHRRRERALSDANRQLEESNELLQELSTLDALTGLYNRRSFDESLRSEWRRVMRELTPLSLLMVDIDYFKVYNDTYGHQMGDDCLQRVAGALRSSLKRAGDRVSRYGGEEFAVILPGTAEAGAQVVAETMLERVERLKIPNLRSRVAPAVTVSIGAASVVPPTEMSLGDLIAVADRALYHAKAIGRNRFEFSRPQLKIVQPSA